MQDFHAAGSTMTMSSSEESDFIMERPRSLNRSSAKCPTESPDVVPDYDDYLASYQEYSDYYQKCRHEHSAWLEKLKTSAPHRMDDVETSFSCQLPKYEPENFQALSPRAKSRISEEFKQEKEFLLLASEDIRTKVMQAQTYKNLRSSRSK